MQRKPLGDRSTRISTRTRTELNAAECRRIALARFRPVKGRLPKWKVLEERFSRQQRVLQTAVRRAFEESLVKITIVPSPLLDCPRDGDVEAALREKFPGLSASIVVDTSKSLQRIFPSGPRSKDKTEWDSEVDDEVHRILGSAMAHVIAEGLAIREDSVVGLGAGRGVYYTLEALMAQKPLTPQNITVLSLTGAVQPRDYMRSLTLPLDSDYHCWLAAKCFRSRVSLQQVWLPITKPSEIDSTPLSEDAWRRTHPDCILAGIGVLSSGHRFYEAVKSKEKDDILEPILPALSELVKLCDELSTTDYNPVADICHRLFYVQRPHEESAKAPKVDQLRRAIDKVNASLLNVSAEQIQSVKELFIVAGTKRKAGAIRELLHQKAYKIRCLCTDKETAALLLQ